jgi:hypothetical protein
MVTRVTDVTDVTDYPTALRTSEKTGSEGDEYVFPPNCRQSEKPSHPSHASRPTYELDQDWQALRRRAHAACDSCSAAGAF